MKAFKVITASFRSGPKLSHEWKIGQWHRLNVPLEMDLRNVYYKNGFFSASSRELAFKRLPIWLLNEPNLTYVEVELGGDIKEDETVPGVFVSTEMKIVKE